MFFEKLKKKLFFLEKIKTKLKGKCHPDRAEWKPLFVLSLVDDFEVYVVLAEFMNVYTMLLMLTVDTMKKC